MGKGNEHAVFQGVSDKQGQVLFGYVLTMKDDHVQYADGAENQKFWVAYVEKDGYAINCRIVDIYADNRSNT